MGKKQRQKKKESRGAAARPKTTTTSVPLSPELAAALGDDAVTATAPQREKEQQGEASTDARPRLSGAQKKRAARAREKAAKFAARESLFEALRRNAATVEELQVLRATADARQHSTAKRRARAAELRERAHLDDDDKRQKLSPPPRDQEDGDENTNGLAVGAKQSAAELVMAQLFALKSSSEIAPEEEATTVAPPKKEEEPAVAAAARASSVVVAPEPKKTTTLLRGGEDEEEEDVPPPPAADTRRWKTRFVARPESLQASRMELPACGMEQEIVEAVRACDVVFVCGETGSGKSTQVPQFLYEAGFGRVVVTSPRRVAAVTTAKRVAYELGCAAPAPHVPGVVAYRTRFDSAGVAASLADTTKLVFETDGVLLREVRRDILLRDYDVVCVDEAHERTLNTDVLLGLLSRAAPLRRRLLLEEDEEEEDTQGEEDDGTSSSAKKETPLKVVIMSASPLDDVFESAALWGRHEAPPRRLVIPGRQHPVTVKFARETDVEDYAGAALAKATELVEAERAALKRRGGVLVFLTGKREVLECCAALRERFARDSDEKRGVTVVPLYAALALEEQERAFRTPGPDEVFVVVATNVAETSVTIPGVAFVVDCGRVKRRVASSRGGAVAFEVGWTSRASAQQRAGRAGRVGPGEVHRLYSAAVYADALPDREPADVEVLPLEDLVLTAKAMGVHDVAKFPFVTQPDAAALRDAHDVLTRLGALQADGGLTDRGHAVASRPVGVRGAAALAACADHHEPNAAGLFAACVAAVAALAERSPFVSGENTRRHRHPFGDAHARVRALARHNDDDTSAEGVDAAALKRTDKLRRSLAKAAAKAEGSSTSSFLALPDGRSTRRDKLLARCVLAGHLDRLARRADPAAVEAAAASEEKLTRFDKDCAYELLCPPRGGRRFAYVSPSSVLHARRRADLPEYLVYSELAVDPATDKLRIHAATVVDAAWVAPLAHRTPFLDLSRPPLDEPAPTLAADWGSVLASRRPALLGGTTWDLPLVRVPLEPDSDLFRLALARLLADGSFFGSTTTPRRARLAADLFAFAAKHRAKKAAALLALIPRGMQSPADLAARLRADAALASALRTALRRCLDGLADDVDAFLRAFDGALLTRSST